MSSKNVRLLSHVASDPTFLFVLRILFFVAFVQVIAAGVILTPQLMNSVAGYLEKRVTLEEEALSIPKNELLVAKKEKIKEATVRPTKSVKKISASNSLQAELSSPAVSLEEEIVSKTVSSGNENGLSEGDSLQIISISHTVGGEGEQTLKIAIKALSHEVISVPEVKVQVYFYDQVAGEVVASKSPVTSRWLNAPVDWRDGDPQLLEVTYQPGNNNPDAHYLGYIVAVYYKGELQAYRADPPSITNQFPIKVYIGRNEL